MGYRVLQVCTSGLHMRRTRVGEIPALSDRQTSSVQGGVGGGDLEKKSTRKRLAGPANDRASSFYISMLDSVSYLETNRDSFQFFSILVIK